MRHYDFLRKLGPVRVRCTRPVLELSVFQLCYSRTSDIGCIIPVTIARIYRPRVRLSIELFVSDRLRLPRFTFCDTNHPSPQ
jgi:hypothetical protein